MYFNITRNFTVKYGSRSCKTVNSIQCVFLDWCNKLNDLMLTNTPMFPLQMDHTDRSYQGVLHRLLTCHIPFTRNWWSLWVVGDTYIGAKIFDMTVQCQYTLKPFLLNVLFQCIIFIFYSPSEVNFLGICMCCTD